MVHKKYTYKDGKKFGPYYYETKRVGGKVITTYLGTELPAKLSVRESINSKKYFIVLSALLIVTIFSFAFYNFYALTGHASLDLKTDYAFGESIEGTFTLNLKSGEFIPSDSNLIVSYGDNQQTIALSSLVTSDLQEGDYYAESTSISGRGLGYGSVGTANIYPEVSFQLRLIEQDSSSESGSDKDKDKEKDNSDKDKDKEKDKDNSSSSSSESGSSGISSESSSSSSSESGSSGISSESSSSSSSESGSSGISSDSNSDKDKEKDNSDKDKEKSSDSGAITGSAIDDDSIIFGTTSGSSEFKKSLSDGQDVELVSGSVVYNGTTISDDSISFEVANGEVVVSSKYSIVSEGFGEEYLGDYSFEVSVDLSQFGLIADLEAPFTIALVYQDISIVSATEDISVSGSLNESNSSLIPEKTILEINESEAEVNITQFDAVIGQPVKWSKKVSFDLNSSVNLFVQIPANAQDIVIEKINATEYAEENELTLEEVTGISSGSLESEIIVSNDSSVSSEESISVNQESSLINEPSSIFDEVIPELTVGVTGNIVSGHVTADISLSKESKLFKSIKKLFGITGKVVDSNGEFISETQELSINVSEDEFGVTLEYVTDAPTAIEEDFGNRKVVHVSGPDEVHYSNVLVFTTLSDSLEITDSSNIVIEWVENLSQSISIYNASDTNGDGNYDYLSWIAPHLSNQTFNLILVEKAKHLDAQYNKIADIFEEVVALDGNWTNEINDTQIVRVTFEQNLNSGNDITLYLNITSGNPIINVYEKEDNLTLATFDNLTNSVLQKIYLTNLSGEQKTFDLQIIGGSVIFDYIVDPVINKLGGPVTDIDMTPLDNETFAIAFVNISSATIQFTVLNTNGTTFTAPVNVFQGVNSNLSRVSITAINSTAVFVGVINGSIDYRLLYAKDGTKLAGPFTGDAALGASIWDVSVTALGLNGIIAYCYVDFTEGDFDMRLFNNNLSIGGPSAPATALELDVNTALLPLSDIQDHIECSATNSTNIFAFGYDSTADDDATYHIVSINRTSGSFPYNATMHERVTDTDIDAAVGNFGQVATASLNGNSSVMVWYNSSAIRYAIRSANNVALRAATDLSKQSGTFSRVSVAAVNNQSVRDFFVTAWYNQSNARLLGAVFDDVGNMVTNHFVIDTAFNPINATSLFDIVGQEAGTGLTLCPGKWAIAYTNSTNSTVIKTYNLAGNTWNGICGSGDGIDDSTLPVVQLKDPANNSITTGSVLTFKADFTDNINASSATLYIYNTSNGVADKLIGTNFTRLGNSSISANISYALNYTGVFYWNFLAQDNTGNKAFNLTNWTVTYSVPDTGPIVQLKDPANNSITTGSVLTFKADFSDNSNVSNATLYIYNTSNGVVDKLIGTNFTGLGNSSISANISYALNYSGIFYWNFLAFDNASTPNSAFNLTNWTVSYDASAPIVLLNNPVNYSITTNGIVSFGTHFLDDVNVSNATLYIYNTTGEAIDKLVATNFTGLGNSSLSKTITHNIALNGTGTYYWNFLAVDSVNRQAFNSTNMTVIYNLPDVAFSPDIDMSPVDNQTFAVIYTDPTCDCVKFTVQNTNSTVRLAPVTVESGVNVNVSRVGVETINDTAFFLAWTTAGGLDRRAGYTITGQNYLAASSGDGSIGNASHDVSLTVFSGADPLIAYCYIDQIEGDADLRIYNASTGVLVAGETDINPAVNPETNLNNLLECVSTGNTNATLIEYDAGTDHDTTIHHITYQAVESIGDSDIDGSVGDRAQEAVTSMNNDRYFYLWYDAESDNFRYAVRGADDTVILATTGFHSILGNNTRVALATVSDRASGGRDNVALAWYNGTGNYTALTIFDENGTKTVSSVQLSDIDTNLRLISALGASDSQNRSICPGKFVVAYLNSSNNTLYGRYNLDGTNWDGLCDVATLSINITSPLNNSGFRYSSAVLNLSVDDSANNSMHVRIYGGTDQNTTNYDMLLYYGNVTDPSNVTYNWSSKPVNRNDSGLFLLYRFDNNPMFGENMSLIKDFSPSNINGIIQTPTDSRGFGYFGKSLVTYSGTNDLNTLTDAPLNSPNLTGEFTAMFWINLTTTNFTQAFPVIAVKSNGVNDRAYGVYLRNSSKAIYVSFGNQTGSSAIESSNNSLLKQFVWYHVAVTLNRDSQNLTIYINGVVNNSANLSLANSLINTSASLLVGDVRGVNNKPTYIDDLALYNRSLSAQEVLNHYQLGNGTYYWKVNVTNDDLGQNETAVYKFSVDSHVPHNVTLLYPNGQSFLSGSIVSFNFSAYDYVDLNMGCNLTIDSLTNVSWINVTNASIMNWSVSGLADGSHQTNVTCWDDAFNRNTSAMNSFTIDSVNAVPYNLSRLVLNTSRAGSYNMSIENLTLWANISDPNGDAMNVTVYWYNGSTLAFIEHNKTNYGNGTLFFGFALYTNVTKNEQWKAGIVITDGVGNSTQINSSSLTIENTPPFINYVDLPQDGNITTDRTPFFNWTAVDIDGDDYSLGINITDMRTATPCNDPTYTGSDSDIFYVSGSRTSISLTHSLKCLIDRGYSYNWSIRANDTDLSGSSEQKDASLGFGWKPYRNVSIQAYLSITATTSQVNFSGINPYQWNDTSDNSPLPLVLRNDGNAYTNITLDSNDLWSSVANPSIYYQFKTDNVTASGENASFRAGQTPVVYTNFPLVDFNVLCVAELNYTDSRDSVEIDINVTVPLDEQPGPRGAVITFVGTLGE